MKASKLAARGLAYIVRAAGRKIGKAHRSHQRPHGKQTVRQLMAHGEATSSIPVDAPALFDRVARKWNVDYAFYQTEPDKYLLFFKGKQADAITACMSEYSKRVLGKEKSRRVPILEQLKKAKAHVRQLPQREQERMKEAVREDREHQESSSAEPALPVFPVGIFEDRHGLPAGRGRGFRP